MILTLGTTPALARSMIFDRVTLDAVNRAREVRVSAAGKSVNVARVLRTLGHDVACTGVVGGDEGKVLVDELSSIGTIDAWVRNDQPTRVCVTMIDRSASHATELVQEAPPAREQDADLILDVLRRTHYDVLVCSGTLAKNIPTDFYAQAAGVNPRAITIIDATRDALLATLHLPIILKCNASELTGTLNASVDDAIAQSLSRGVRAAIVSDGIRPTTVATKDARWTIDTPRVDVVSPIGSGDAMAAGVAAGIERGWPLIDAARLGVACAAANAQTAIAGGVDRAEVDRLFASLRASRV